MINNMETKLNKTSYQKLIDEDIIWLLNQPRTLEREHIEAVLKDSVDIWYNKKPKKRLNVKIIEWLMKPNEPSFDWGFGRKTMFLWMSVCSDLLYFMWRIICPVIGLIVIVRILINMIYTN
jgi:hypothetical protein